MKLLQDINNAMQSNAEAAHAAEQAAELAASEAAAGDTKPHVKTIADYMDDIANKSED